MVNREEFLKRSTEMVVMGEQFVECSKKIRDDYKQFEDEIVTLTANDPDFSDLNDRASKIIMFLEGRE